MYVHEGVSLQSASSSCGVGGFGFWMGGRWVAIFDGVRMVRLLAWTTTQCLKRRIDRRVDVNWAAYMESERTECVFVCLSATGGTLRGKPRANPTVELKAHISATH